MRVRASWALPVLSSRSASKAAGRGQGSRAPRPGTVATTGLNSGRTMPQGQLGPFRGPGREAKQEGVGHKLTWHLLACFQVLPGWNSPRGHLIELPRLNQNFMSAPQDPPSQFSESCHLYLSARLLPEEHQHPLQGSGDNGTEISARTLGGWHGAWHHWEQERGSGPARPS